MPYAAPTRLEDAISLLSTTPGARVLAGGHQLLVEPSRSRLGNALLVDLRRIRDLAGVTAADGGVRIGAMTTLADIAANDTIRRSYSVLAAVAGATGDAQLRNRATIGGSLAISEPDNEYPAIAVLLSATVEIRGKKTRSVHADDFFSGNGSPEGGEIITALTLPDRIPRTGFAFVAHRNPATRTPLCGAGVGVALDEAGGVTAARVVLVGAAERPVRQRAVEKLLVKNASADEIRSAAAAAEGVAMRNDLFASADYRRHLTGVLTERALKQAVALAGGK